MLQPFEPIRLGKSGCYVDESASWYKVDSTLSEPSEEELDVNSDDDVRPLPIPLESPNSTMMSGPQEPQSVGCILQIGAGLDKGKGKLPEYEVNHLDERDSDVSACSLDSEFGVPIM